MENAQPIDFSKLPKMAIDFSKERNPLGETKPSNSQSLQYFPLTIPKSPNFVYRPKQKQLNINSESQINDTRVSGSKQIKRLTKQNSMFLSTELRAQQRKQFDEYLKTKHQTAELIRKQIEQERQLAEEQYVKELRKQTVFKSKPFRNVYAPIELKPSEKPLTEPIAVFKK